jgi:hypothetical protein
MSKSRDIYNAPASKVAEYQLVRPVWLTLAISLYVLVIAIGSVGYLLKDGTLEGAFFNLVLVCMLSAPAVGIWRLEYWGPAVGILGFLVLQIKIFFNGHELPTGLLLIPVIHFLIFIWLKRIKAK